MVIQVRPEAPKSLENLLKCTFSVAKGKSNRVILPFSISGEEPTTSMASVFPFCSSMSPTISYLCLCPSFAFKSFLKSFYS